MLKDETGNIYNRLTVIKRGPNNSSGCARWYCQCSCGNPELVLVLGSSLRNGHTQSCGCLHKETAQKQGIANRKTNTYDLTKEYGIGYTLKGEEFYFDLEDYDCIKDYCWHKAANGYIVCKRKENVLQHRLITNAPDEYEVDHINHNTVDNRKSNLRLCTHSQNGMNRDATIASTSGVKGVYWYSKPQKWSAEITIDGQKILLGQFTDINDAITARKKAEEKLFKEFCYQGKGE